MPFSIQRLCVLALATLVQVSICLPQADDSQYAQDSQVSTDSTVTTNAKVAKFTVGQAVKTTSGTVVGHAAANASEVSEYLGIPYAQAPVGNLRFAAPQKYKGNSTITAASFSPDCPANTGLLAGNIGNILPFLAGPNSLQLLAELGQVGNVQSEDCLSINVWTKPQTGSKKKAVMLWIYGGGFSTGSSNNPTYNGKYFADNEDVVVVSFNYRLNVFGFPGLPDVQGVAQNAGLLDQRLAVEWVRDNIAAFGGDPKRITLFGQSAGGASVDYYSFAWTEDPIVNAFIEQSGTAISFSDPPPTNSTQSWFNASIALGCGGPSVGLPASVACVRTKPYQALLNATVVTDPLKAVLGNFGPTSDGKVVFSNYEALALSGNFIQRPLLVGNNNYEAGLFKILAASANISDSEWCIFDAAIFTCPAAKAAKARALNQVNTFRYRYYGEFPNLRLTLNPSSGAWHGAEIPVIFQTAEEASGAPNTPAETSISQYLHHMWASFAKDPEHALYDDPFGFPQYNPLTQSLIKLANHNQTQPTLAFPVETDSICTLLDALSLLIPGGLTNALTGGSSGGDLTSGLSLPTTCSPLD